MTPPAPPPDSPLTPAQRQQLATAAKGLRALNGVVALATFNAWSLAIVAALALPFAFFDATSLVVMIGLAACAFTEFRGRAGIRRLRPESLRHLAYNQFALIALVTAYCLWTIYHTVTGPNPYEKDIADNPELGSMIGSLGDLTISLTWVVYGSIIVLVALFQGLAARYYFSRIPLLRQHLASTPAWALDIIRLATQ